MDFPGFRPESFDFFARLSENNNQEWFEANAEAYRDHVLEPFRALARDLDPFLRELHPRFAVREEVDEQFSLLERGDRAPTGTPPYKTSFYAFFWDRDYNRLSDGTLYIGLSAEGVSIGFSIYDFGTDPQAKMRRVFKPRIRRHLSYLDEYIKSQYLRRGFDFHRYARAPGRLGMREVDAFPEVAARWENTLGWVVKRQLHTESSRLTPGSFVAEVRESFERLYPLYVFCCDPREDFKRVVRVPGVSAQQVAAEVEAARAEAFAAASPPPPAAVLKEAAAASTAGAGSTAPAVTSEGAAPKKGATPKAAAAKEKKAPSGKKSAPAKKKPAARKKTAAKKTSSKGTKASAKKKAASRKKTAAKKKAATRKKTVAKKTSSKGKKASAKKKTTSRKKAPAKSTSRTTSAGRRSAKKPASRKKASSAKKATSGTRMKSTGGKKKAATRKKKGVARRSGRKAR